MVSRISGKAFLLRQNGDIRRLKKLPERRLKTKDH